MSGRLRAAAVAFRTQLRVGWRTGNYWSTLLISIPQTVIFLSFTQAFGRPDLLVNAIVAPILMTMWSTALWAGGAVMRDDRWQGRLEVHAAAPTPYALVVVARVAAVVALSLLVVPIALTTAWLTYGIDIQLRHPGLLALTLLVVALAVVGTGIVFSSMTLLSRAATTFQSSASYPFLLLGGVFVPLSLLPGWTQPLGRLVFLSWGSDLMRDSVSAPQVTDAAWRLLVVAGLGWAGFLLGRRLFGAVMRRIRLSGEISSA